MYIFYWITNFLGPGSCGRKESAPTNGTWDLGKKDTGLCPFSVKNSQWCVTQRRLGAGHTELPRLVAAVPVGSVPGDTGFQPLCASLCSRFWVPHAGSSPPYTKQPPEWGGRGGGEGHSSVTGSLLFPSLVHLPLGAVLWLDPSGCGCKVLKEEMQKWVKCVQKEALFTIISQVPRGHLLS